MTSSQLDINEIVKEMRVLHEKIDKLENIVEKRLVGIEKPDSYEKKAVADFEKKKKAGKLEFTKM
jgi:hypothetical protein